MTVHLWEISTIEWLLRIMMMKQFKCDTGLVRTFNTGFISTNLVSNLFWISNNVVLPPFFFFLLFILQSHSLVERWETSRLMHDASSRRKTNDNSNKKKNDWKNILELKKPEMWNVTLSYWQWFVSEILKEMMWLISSSARNNLI